MVTSEGSARTLVNRDRLVSQRPCVPKGLVSQRALCPKGSCVPKGLVSQRALCPKGLVSTNSDGHQVPRQMYEHPTFFVLRRSWEIILSLSLSRSCFSQLRCREWRPSLSQNPHPTNTHTSRVNSPSPSRPHLCRAWDAHFLANVALQLCFPPLSLLRPIHRSDTAIALLFHQRQKKMQCNNNRIMCTQPTDDCASSR